MNGAVFAASDQSQTWTSLLSADRQTERHIFTKEEQTILDKYEEVKHIIQTNSNTVEAAKCRKDSWQKKKLPMCECVN